MKFLGKYGEYKVLAYLLGQDIEAYLAIKTNQDDYDLTVILNNNKIVRVQVKTTDLHNKSTNNPLDRIDKKYDYLVVVIIEKDRNVRFFVMSKRDAIKAKGGTKRLGTSEIRKK
ncbi:MAG: hypothetical protein P8179_23550, partial [Candidatus Thiodiazotropha sp.]